MTAKTDSKLKSNEAITGSVFFCATICKVYATPQDNTPAYNIGAHANSIDDILGSSNINVATKEINPQTKNCIHDIFTPSKRGE